MSVARPLAHEADGRGFQMDDRTKELVLGASAAPNCHACMDHHLPKCDELGTPREEVLLKRIFAQEK